MVARGISYRSSPPRRPLTRPSCSLPPPCAASTLTAPCSPVERVAPGTRWESQRTLFSSTMMTKPPSELPRSAVGFLRKITSMPESVGNSMRGWTGSTAEYGNERTSSRSFTRSYFSISTRNLHPFRCDLFCTCVHGCHYVSVVMVVTMPFTSTSCVTRDALL
jgi:hypothetical protein